MSFYKRYQNNKFHQLFKNTPIVDWCKVMSGTSKISNDMLIKAAVLFIKSKFPEMISKCPYHPFSIDMVNVTIDRRIISMIPTGVYRTLVVLRSKNKDIIMEVSSLLEAL